MSSQLDSMLAVLKLMWATLIHFYSRISITNTISINKKALPQWHLCDKTQHTKFPYTKSILKKGRVTKKGKWSAPNTWIDSCCIKSVFIKREGWPKKKGNYLHRTRGWTLDHYQFNVNFTKVIVLSSWGKYHFARRFPEFWRSLIRKFEYYEQRAHWALKLGLPNVEWNKVIRISNFHPSFWRCCIAKIFN